MQCAEQESESEMALKVAVQMDHISGINIVGDSTFAMLLEAQHRGHELFHYTPDRLAFTGDQVRAVIEPLSVRDEDRNHFELGESADTDLSDMDVILLRQDPPFDMAYISTTHILEALHPKTLVVNNPQAVRNAPEKVLVMQFSQFMPKTVVTRDTAVIKAFRDEHKDIVIKPLYGNGGAAVFRLREGDENLGSLLGIFGENFREPYVIQEYRPEVREGDKRIILMNGEFVGAINRVPLDDDLRSNLVQGGRAEVTALTDREKEICAALGPTLRERDILFAGIDVIGGFLTEINVTSPTGLRAIERLGGGNLAGIFWDHIERKLKPTH